MNTTKPGAMPGASISRSRTATGEVREAADALLRASLARSAISPTTTGSSTTTITPATSAGTEAKPEAAPTTATRTSAVGPDPAMAADMKAAADRARLAASMRMPAMGPGPESASRTMTRTRGAATATKADEELSKMTSEIRLAPITSLPAAGTVDMTTTRTRERLRMAEIERDAERARASEMRARADEERAIVERLKKEGDGGLTATEAELRILKLKYDALRAGEDAPPRYTVEATEGNLFKAACSTDLLFLIDTTSSMRPYIEAAKNQIRSIVDDIKTAFLNEADVRIGVVSYKDHCDSPNVQLLDFTSDVKEVHAFLDTLQAKGGGDPPEDVLGGLQQALNATWQHQTRCIIHIADAPPHGRTLHDLGDDHDDYPVPGSEPHHLKHGPLLAQMLSLKINYALLRINFATDLMAFTFLEAYAAVSKNCRLHESNEYFDRGVALTGTGGGSLALLRAGLQFSELELGTAYSALRHLVVKSVTTAASRTASRMATLKGGANRPTGPGASLSTLAEEETETILEEEPPKWGTDGWLDETLRMEAYSTDVEAGTLDAMMANDDNIKISTTELTIHKRSKPFAQGAMRVAAYAGTTASTSRLVVKSFKKGRKRLADLAEEMRCQALCKAFALEFNALVTGEQSVDFIVVTTLRHKSRTRDDCMSLEPYIPGEYVKYNSNAGFVNEDKDDPFNQAAQAFSHFTFERSRGYFLVADLQGVGNVLTDPAIHTYDPRRFNLADANLGVDGFKFFFATHECNDICRGLGLKSNSSMFMSGSFKFRDRWPEPASHAGPSSSSSSETRRAAANMMVCCSNKLCSKIVKLSTAHRSSDFPGFHWCDACWPQLHSTMIEQMCVAGGAPHHVFHASTFFYESQGQIMPRRCEEHRASRAFVSRSAGLGLRMAADRGRSAGAGGGDSGEATDVPRAIARHVTGGISIFGSRR